jgi:hypothetical protein
MRGMCPQTHAHVKKTAHENCEKPAILKAIMRFATETSLGHQVNLFPLSRTQLLAIAISRQQEALTRGKKKASGVPSMLSPVDARRLTPAQCARDGHGALFFLDRAKTGRAAAGTLTRWSQAIMLAYLKRLWGPACIFAATRQSSGIARGRRTQRIPWGTISEVRGRRPTPMIRASSPICGALERWKAMQAAVRSRTNPTRWRTRFQPTTGSAKPTTR